MCYDTLIAKEWEVVVFCMGLFGIAADRNDDDVGAIIVNAVADAWVGDEPYDRAGTWWRLTTMFRTNRFDIKRSRPYLWNRARKILGIQKVETPSYWRNSGGGRAVGCRSGSRRPAKRLGPEERLCPDEPWSKRLMSAIDLQQEHQERALVEPGQELWWHQLEPERDLPLDDYELYCEYLCIAPLCDVPPLSITYVHHCDVGRDSAYCDALLAGHGDSRS